MKMLHLHRQGKLMFNRGLTAGVAAGGESTGRGTKKEPREAALRS